MALFFVAVLLGICPIFGLVLRYAVFAPVIRPRQKRILLSTYVVLSVTNILIMTGMLHTRGLTVAFTYLRYGAIGYAFVMTLLNILVIRRWVQEQLFVAGVVLTCNYLLMSVPNFAITFLQQPDIRTNLFVILTLYIGVLLLAQWPLYTLLHNALTPFLEMDHGGYWNTIWFIPIAFFGTKFINLGGAHNTGGIAQLASSILYISVIALICLSISSDQKRMQEQSVIQRQLEDQKHHYTELQVRVEEARKTKHDFKHHIAAIRHYMDIDDKEGLRSYCNTLMERTDGQGVIPYTGNSAADGILYYYMQRAQQENIHFRYSGTIHSQGIADVDLCALLGNALDNALTASLTIPQGRSITVISQSEQRLLSIVIRNGFDGKLEQSKEGLLSRKRTNSHGIGLASMKSICQRYGGSLDVQWDEHSFTAMIILPLAENP